jgi:hypothetical protein
LATRTTNQGKRKHGDRSAIKGLDKNEPKLANTGVNKSINLLFSLALSQTCKQLHHLGLFQIKQKYSNHIEFMLAVTVLRLSLSLDHASTPFKSLKLKHQIKLKPLKLRLISK